MLARPARRATYHRALRSGELIPQNERELRRSAGSGMLKGDPLIRGAMLAPPITSSGERRTHSSAHRWPSGWGEQCGLYQQRALGSGKLIPRNEWTFRRSEGSGILIGNPPKVRGVMLALPTASSGERRTHPSALRRERHAHRWPRKTHSSEWEGTHLFLPLLSRKFPPNLGQVDFTVVTGELERNERACLSLTRASLSP